MTKDPGLTVLEDSIGLAIGTRGDAVELLQTYLETFGYVQVMPRSERRSQTLLSTTRAGKRLSPLFVNSANAVVSRGVFDAGTEIALRQFQTFAGLQPTGVLDAQTLSRLKQPRCGNPDMVSGLSRAAAGSSPWPSTHLTYGFQNFTPDLMPAETRSAIADALSLWSQVTVLSFAEHNPPSDADFVIRFVSGDHGDGKPFDGPGGVLAHAFYPPPRGGDLSGDAHFDESETWAVNLPIPANRIDLVTIAAHELGHSLGLDHSPDSTALMFAFYSGSHRYLAPDDVASIRSIYEWQWRIVYAQPYPGAGIGTYDLTSPADLAIAFDFSSTRRQDHLVLFRPGAGVAHIITPSGPNYRTVFASPYPGAGIGTYDLASPNDQMTAFDFDSSGKEDHLLLYRPGGGVAHVMRQVAGSFETVFASPYPGAGIGSFDLASPLDRVIAIDFDSAGTRDHLLFYRPGGGTVHVQKRSGGGFQLVMGSAFPGAGFGTFDLASPLDQAIAYDYDSSGIQDHVVFYRPGSGIVHILRRSGGAMRLVFSSPYPGAGIGTFDLASPYDRLIAFDYDGTGKKDHILAYRPGGGNVHILKPSGGNFVAVFTSPSGVGIGRYDLASPLDKIVSFDYDHAGREDHLFLCRPGSGLTFILERKR